MHAQKLVEKAKDAEERRAFDLAIELYMQAITLEPDHLEARRGLRRAELEKAKGFYPSGVSRFFGGLGGRLSSKFAGVSKNHEKRMLALEKVLLADPKNAAAGMELASAALAAGHKNAAIAAYEGVLESDPKHIEALKGLGRTLYQVNQPHEALDAFEKALKLDPRDQEASRMRKNLAAEVSISRSGYDQAGHSRDLIKDREQQRELEEGSRVVRSADDIAESLKAIEEKLGENPDDPRLLAELGSRHAALKDYDQAIVAYDRAYELQPTNFSFREKAAQYRISRYNRDIETAENAGDRKAVEKLKKERQDFQLVEFRQQAKDHPTDLGIRYKLARTLYDVGDMDGAISEFQQTVRDPRRKIESLTMLGNCFIKKGMFDLAENQLAKALEETSGMSDRKKEILYSLGLLKARQGNHEGALEELKKIYEVDINFRDVSERMATIRKEMAGS